MTAKEQSQKDHTLALLRERGMVRLREFSAAGIHEETVARLTRNKTIVRLARGLYQLPDANLEAGHSLAESAKMAPRGVICLISALQFHGLTVQLPPTIWMAIDRTARKPAIAYPPIRFVRFGGASLSTGVETHLIESVAVHIYSPAKTVVDCFRYRNKIGLDIALEGLREVLRQKKTHPNEIAHHAKSCRAWTVIKPYLVAMLADSA